MPLGEYAQSCLGRERIFEYFSRSHGTPILIFRLNYAVDLRYGVLVDIARKIHEGLPVDLAVPRFNVIWQGDANSYAIRSLELCESPPRILNVTGPEIISCAARPNSSPEIHREAVFFETRERRHCSATRRMSFVAWYPSITAEVLMEWVVTGLKLEAPASGADEV
jgi:hypothetical protein